MALTSLMMDTSGMSDRAYPIFNVFIPLLHFASCLVAADGTSDPSVLQFNEAGNKKPLIGHIISNVHG